MEAIIARALGADRVVVAMQFLRFGAVGFLGFFVDTAVVYASRGWLGLYGAGVLAYLVTASVNWVLNRLWTFRGKSRDGQPMHRQWGMFMATNLIGFVLNRGMYAILVTVSPFVAANPVFAVAAGAVCGLFTNFSLSRRVVFR
jgi:putative flippase GtrA